MNNFVCNLLNKYEALPPKRKAMVDVLGMLFSAMLVGGLSAIVVAYSLWMELAFALIAYGLYGMIKIIYQIQVSHYEFVEKYRNDKNSR